MLLAEVLTHRGAELLLAHSFQLTITYRTIDRLQVITWYRLTASGIPNLSSATAVRPATTRRRSVMNAVAVQRFLLILSMRRVMYGSFLCSVAICPFSLYDVSPSERPVTLSLHPGQLTP